jgi:hypothetical protein
MAYTTGFGFATVGNVAPLPRAAQIIDMSQVRITGTTALLAMFVPPNFDIPLKSN